MKVQSLLVTRVNFKRSKRPRFQLAPRVDDSFVTDCSLHPAPQAKTFDTSCPASRPLKIRPEKFVPCVQLARDGNLPTIWISRRGSNARNLFYLLFHSSSCSSRFAVQSDSSGIPRIHRISSRWLCRKNLARGIRRFVSYCTNSSARFENVSSLTSSRYPKIVWSVLKVSSHVCFRSQLVSLWKL